MEEEEKHGIDRLDHKVKATMDLSGTTVHVGVYQHIKGDSLFLQTPEMHEPMYFTDREGDLLVAAVCASQDYLRGMADGDR